MNVRETWTTIKTEGTIQRHKQHWAEGTEKNQQHRKLKDEHHGPIQIRVDR